MPKLSLKTPAIASGLKFKPSNCLAKPVKTFAVSLFCWSEVKFGLLRISAKP